MIKSVASFLTGICLLSFACATNSRAEQPAERIDHVERVFMHQDHEYSLLVRDTTTRALQTRRFVLSDAPKIFDDVPTGQAMWAVYRRVDIIRSFAPDRYEAHLEIHVRGTRDIKGAGWKVEDDGDIYQGTTHVVE